MADENYDVKECLARLQAALDELVAKIDGEEASEVESEGGAKKAPLMMDDEGMPE